MAPLTFYMVNVWFFIVNFLLLYGHLLTFYMAPLTFYIVNVWLFIWSPFDFLYGHLWLFIWSTFDFLYGQLLTFYMVIFCFLFGQRLTFYSQLFTFYMVTFWLFIWHLWLFIWSTFDFLYGQLFTFYMVIFCFLFGQVDFFMVNFLHFVSVSVKADCTFQTADYRPGVKCRLWWNADWRLQTRGKRQTRFKRNPLTRKTLEWARGRVSCERLAIIVRVDVSNFT